METFVALGAVLALGEAVTVGVALGVGAAAWLNFTLIVGAEKVNPSALRYK